MNEEQILEIITKYKMFYPGTFKDYTIQDVGLMVKLWKEKFIKYTYEEMMITADRLTTTSKWMPSVSEIIADLEKHKTPLLQLNAIEEWDKVIQAVRDYGSYKTKEALDSLDKYTSNVVRQLGWIRLCESTIDELQWIRKQFIEMFENQQDKDYEALAMLESNMTLAELTRLAKLKHEETLQLEEK